MPRRARLSPQRLAKLANALGVPTPVPAVPNPSPALATSNSFLLHVIPPAYLADHTPGCHNHFLRGTLVPLHSTLHAQLAAIAREYALPSTAGLVLYLISEPDGPRLSDDIWRLLWSRVVSVERSPSPSPSPLRPLTCSPSPSTPSSVPSAFRQDTLHSDPPTPDTSIDTPPARSPSRHLLLPGLTSPSLLPILAKVEFDIDKRKATWYNPWINSRLSKRSNAPRELLTVKRSEMLKKDPLGLNIPPAPIHVDDEDDNELDEDATATFTNHRDTTSDDNEGFSTKAEEVLELLETMSVRSKSRSSSNSHSRSSSTHSSLARKVVLSPLVTNITKDTDTDMEQSYLAYTEPLPSPLPEGEDSFHISNKEVQGGKREFAVFDDLELEFDHTLQIDDDDPNDRRKSQLIMRAKLDEIERTMAQLSPRMLHSDLSPDRTSMRVSPTSPKGLEFLSPSEDVSRSFITSSPPRLRKSDEQETEDKSWPTIPFSMIKEKEQGLPESVNPNALPPPPRLALNGVSTSPRAFVPPPSRPPPPPPLPGGIGISNAMTETAKRRRELEEEQGVYEVTFGRDSPLESDGGIIPLSPDPFGRYPSSSPNEPPPNITGGVPETRARSGTVTTTTTTSKSRFSADSGDEPIPSPASGGLKPTSNRTTLMSVRTIKKLWRRSKEKEKNGGGDVPPPTPVTPVTPTIANFASSAGSSNDIDKSLPSIPPPRPSRPSEEQLDFPDISMQAALPPRLTPSPRLSRPLIPINGDIAQANVNGGSGRRTPIGQEHIPTGRRTPQGQPAVPPHSRPSLDQLTAPSPPPALAHTPPPQQQQILQQPVGGRRTPQEVMFRPPSRPSLDQQAVPSPSAVIHALPPQQHTHFGGGSGRRTPQDQLPFRPPSRPSLDQQPSVAPTNHPHPHTHAQPPPHPSHFRHPSQTQQSEMQMPMFQGRIPNNGPVTPLLAMHYPSRSKSVSQQQIFDMNRLLFDQESPYPVRLASFAGGTTAAAATVTPAANVTVPATSYGGGSASLGTGARASPPPPPPPQPSPSVEPEKPAAITTMRKSILKWKLANTNGNSNPNGNLNNQGSSDTSSSSSSSSTSSSIVGGGGGAVPRQSFERFERPGAAGSNGVYGHARGGGGGGRRPSVINFGSTSSLSSSTSVSSNRGVEIPRNPQVPAQYTMVRSGSASSSSGGESKANHVHFKIPPHPSIPTPSPTNQKPPPSLSLSLSTQNPKDLQPTPSPQSLSPSRQSFDSQSPSSAVERRSNASSFDMTQFEFVSPVLPASAPAHDPLRT